MLFCWMKSWISPVPSRRIHEGDFPLSALEHDPPDDGMGFAFPLLELVLRSGVGDRAMTARRIGIEARIAEGLELRDADLLEVIEFHDYDTCTIV